MNIVYDNIIFSLQKCGGISLYWYELIKRIRNKKYVTYFEHANGNIFRKTFTINVNCESDLPLKVLRYLPFIKLLPSKSIFHSSYYRVRLQKDIINITTVHDFTYEYFRSGFAKYAHIWQKYFAIKNSDGVICISENTKKDLINFLPKIDQSKIKVIYNGVGEEFHALENATELLTNEFKILNGKKYILYIGDRSGYKNFNLTVKVLNKLTDYSLVVVGGQEFSAKEKNTISIIYDRVFHFKSLDSDKLNIIYNNAFSLLYPSSYEGFGLPVLEAMKAGCPVISTNSSSIPEVAGDACLLVNEINVSNFLREIKKLEVIDFRKGIIKNGLKQSSKFSWDKCYNDTHEFYKTIYNIKFKN